MSAAAVGATVAMGLIPSGAAAARHVYDPGLQIGSACIGLPCQLSEPAGVAVSEATGVLYVVDKGGDRVERFDAATGAYLGQFDGGATYEDGGETKPTTEAGHGSIGFPEEVESGAFEEPVGIAVDNSCSLQRPPLTGAACEAFDPSYGDVYVADERQASADEPPTDHAVVDKFGPSGGYIGQITRNVTSPGFSELGFIRVLGVAVDPTG